MVDINVGSSSPGLAVDRAVPAPGYGGAGIVYLDVGPVALQDVFASVAVALNCLPMGELVAVILAIVVRGLDSQGGKLAFCSRGRGNAGLCICESRFIASSHKIYERTTYRRRCRHGNRRDGGNQ